MLPLCFSSSFWTHINIYSLLKCTCKHLILQLNFILVYGMRQWSDRPPSPKWYFPKKPFHIDLSRIDTYTYTIISLPTCFLILWRELYVFPVLDYGQMGRMGIWSNLVWLHLGKATCWTHFPDRHGCWYQRQLLGYILTICTSLPFLWRDTTMLNYSLGMRPMKIGPMTIALQLFPSM